MKDLEKTSLHVHRRAFLTRGASGLGLLALKSLLNPRLLAGDKPASNLASLGAVNPLHLPPKA